MNNKETMMNNQDKRTIAIPLCKDSQISDPVDTNFIAKSIKLNLKAYEDAGDEYVSFIIRTQNENGEWCFGIATTSLKDLESGAEVYLTKNKKLVME